jgi:N-acetylneuraminate lyase
MKARHPVRKPRGLVAAPVTPMHEDGAVDIESFRAHVRDLLDGGVEGLFIAGTTGEGLLLTAEERETLVRTAVEVAARHVPIIGHSGTFRTDDAAALASRLRRAGADAVAALTPFFYGVDAEAMTAHFRRIADAAECPTYLYSIPAATGVDLPVEVVRALVPHPHFGGVKYSQCNLGTLRRYVETGADVLIGCDALITEAMSQGAVGTISGTAACMPALHARLFGCLRGGTDPAPAQAAVSRFDGILARLPAIAGYKAVLVRRGIIGSAAVRRPLRALRLDELRQLDAALETVYA